MRLICIFSVIMCHWGFNSGILVEHFNPQAISLRMLFIQWWSMWGKTAINAFVLITGFFMCTKDLTPRKFIKLYFQVKFLRYICFAYLLYLGIETWNYQTAISYIFNIGIGINGGFTGSFVIMYLLIPFLNQFWRTFVGGRICALLWTLLGAFVGTVTLFSNNAFNEPCWYITLYFLGAYFRQYAGDWSKSVKLTFFMMICCIAVSMLSVAIIDFIIYKYNIGNWLWPFYFVHDSSKLMAFLTGVSVFLFFKNVNIPYNKYINEMAKTVFGILLIHGVLRNWIWYDVFHVSMIYERPFVDIIINAIISCTIVFFTCMFLDYMRIKFVEEPFLRWYDVHLDVKINEWLKRFK